MRMRKITVSVSKKDLAEAQALTGKGVTETVRECLELLASLQDQKTQRKLSGEGGLQPL